MTVYNKRMGNSSICIKYDSSPQSNLQVIERKGWGHPDKLADDLAETLSRVYSKYTLKKCGVVLHHNFDKLCLLGGASEVSYGGGKITKPIKVLVNGRVSQSFGGQDLKIDDLINQTCKDFFKRRLPLINVNQDIDIIKNINLASSPGGVKSNESSPRHRWFNPLTVEDLPEHSFLHANDTSLGTGYAPMSRAENLVLSLTDYLSNPLRESRPNWLGTDVKVMAYSDEKNADLTICIPQLAQYVNNRKHYIENLEWIDIDIASFISKNFSDLNVDYVINARDKVEIDEIYLTLLGTSIESGDEGVVGRGNRINGLITPMRPMNLEGANGKNPVYHVGKVYNVLANVIAEEIYKITGAANSVNLISRTGSSLLAPWKIVVQTEGKNDNPDRLFSCIQELCSEIPNLTKKVIHSTIEEFPLS